MMDPSDVVNRFKYHPPELPRTVIAHEGVRNSCLQLAAQLNESLPEGREKSLAITHLEEVMMWSNAAIARNQ